MKKVNNILKNTAVACAILLISGGSIKGQWTPATVPADTYWSPTTSSVGIGVMNPQYKLHVVEDNTNPGGSAGQFEYTSPTNVVGTYFALNAICTDASGNGNDNIGIQATAQDGGVTNTGNATGFQGFAIKTGNGNTYGGNLSATGGDIAYGVNATANSAGTDNYGVYGAAGATGGTGNNIGVYGEGSVSGAGNINAGVYGKINATGATVDAGVYGEDNSGSGYAGWFEGDIFVNGTAFKSGTLVWTASDARIKTKVQPLDNVLESLMNVKIYNYEYSNENHKDLNFPKGNQIGVIAQELKLVFPDMVREAHKGLNHVSYETFTPILIRSLQEQQQQIEELKQTIFELTQHVSKNIIGIGQTNPIELFFMEQNIPNPFSGETSIKYNLPLNCNIAMLAIYDLSGKQVSSFELTEKGSAVYKLTAENLSPGIYLYSIIADGKVMDTKRMVIAGH